MKPKFWAGLVFIIMAILSAFMVSQQYKIHKEDEQGEMRQVLNVVKQNIDQSLKSSYISTLTLALTINDEGEPENFEEVAKEIIDFNPYVDAVQLVPDGVIKYIYPQEGNEKAYNYNILESESTVKEANKAIENREIYFAGPLKLKQGGVGIVGRLPVFSENGFWGFSAVIIKLGRLLEESGIDQLANHKYYVQFSKINPNSGEEEFFLKEKNISLSSALKTKITDGNWNIYITPVDKHAVWLTILPFAVFGFLLSALSGFFTSLVLEKPEKMQVQIHHQEREIISTESKFKAIFDQAGLGIAHVRNDGSFIEINSKFIKIVGYSKEEFAHKKIQEIYTHSIQWNQEKLTKTKTTFAKKNQKKIPVKLTVSPLFVENEEVTYIVIVEDISDKKRKDERIVELTSRMEMALRVSKLGYWEWKVENDDINWSPRMFEIFGVEKDAEITSEMVLDRIHPEDLQKYKKQTKILLSGGETLPYECRIIHPDGSISYILAHVEAEKNNKGKVERLKGSMLNVTREKEAEKNLNASYRLVLEQNKRLLNFSYIVSHNLRSHSSNLQSLIMLVKDASSAQEQEKIFSMLKTVVLSLDKTLYDLNDVLNIQRNTNISVEEISIKKYINKIIHLLAGQVKEKEAVFRLHLPNDLKIRFNPAYLESILLNCISNSIRYSHPKRSPEIDIFYEKTDDYHILFIKDNGIGIDLEKNKDKLFGMYKTFSNQKGSRGMGLFVSKNQLESLGGKISMESNVGKGCTCKLHFKI